MLKVWAREDNRRRKCNSKFATTCKSMKTVASRQLEFERHLLRRNRKLPNKVHGLVYKVKHLFQERIDLSWFTSSTSTSNKDDIDSESFKLRHLFYTNGIFILVLSENLEVHNLQTLTIHIKHLKIIITEKETSWFKDESAGRCFGIQCRFHFQENTAFRVRRRSATSRWFFQVSAHPMEFTRPGFNAPSLVYLCASIWSQKSTRVSNILWKSAKYQWGGHL